MSDELRVLRSNHLAHFKERISLLDCRNGIIFQIIFQSTLYLFYTLHFLYIFAQKALYHSNLYYTHDIEKNSIYN